MEELLDNNIQAIYSGELRANTFPIGYVKMYIYEYVQARAKKDSTGIMGAVAEFFIHLYLTTNGYKQQCLYKNLEETSPKKGFDGVYFRENKDEKEYWYMESKSGSSASATHTEKVKEAYRDLKSKFAGKSKNDPWANACYHAYSVGASDDVVNIFRELSVAYKNKKFEKIEDYNIIPCGTVYYSLSEPEPESDDIYEDLNHYFISRNSNRRFCVCISNYALDEFIQYLQR